MTDTPADYTAAVDAIRSRINNAAPQIGLVLGSGLGTLADELDNRIVIPYSDIPGWPQSTVHGHSGNLVIGELEGKLVVTQQGRAHFYEGYTPQQITFPIRVMHFLGVKTLILTNAAGGMNTDFSVGDIMVINDHIYFIGMAGVSPLVGPNDESIGERFVGMAQTYDRELRTLAEKVAADSGETLQKGVYVCVSGPQFETPTEIRALRMMGGDAVGMSTAHEVVTARHAGMRVLAFSSITNIAIDEIDTELETSHVEVMEAGAVIVPKLAKIVRGVVREMSV
ncbi:MAG: purine-nucleoside phosphorylase [Chloroflexota bacterium]